MKPAKFITLLIIAIILVAGAIIAYRKQSPTRAPEAEWRGKPLLADMKDKVQDVSKLEITRHMPPPQDQATTGTTMTLSTIVLQRGDANSWKIASKWDYPADPNTVNRVLLALTEAKNSDRLTKNPEKYAAFGVKGDVGEEGVIKASAADKPMATMILGAARKVNSESDANVMPGGHYVRVNQDPYVYMTNNDDLWGFTPDITRWVKGEILSVPMDDITAIRLDRPTTATLELVWDDGTLKLPDLPAGMQMKKAGGVDDIRSAMQSLRMEGVLKQGVPEAQGLDFNSSYTANAKDGTIYKVRIAEKGKTGYISMKAEYGQPFFTDEDKKTTTSLANAQKKAETAKNGIAEFNKQHGSWIYALSSYQYEKFIKTRRMLMEPIKPAEEKMPPMGQPGATMPGAMPGAMPGVGMPGGANMQPQMNFPGQPQPTRPGAVKFGGPKPMKPAPLPPELQKKLEERKARLRQEQSAEPAPAAPKK